MKVYYQCETCGKKFQTKEEAVKCESEHEAERARREKLRSEKSERIKKINELIQSYVDDYNEFPSVKVEGNFIRGNRDLISDFIFRL